MECWHDDANAPAEPKFGQFIVCWGARVAASGNKNMRIIEPCFETESVRGWVPGAHGDQIMFNEQFFTVQAVISHPKE